jgi:hypothetical protein
MFELFWRSGPRARTLYTHAKGYPPVHSGFDTRSDLDNAVLESLDFLPNTETCDMQDCDEAASWMVLCGRASCGEGEPICHEHHGYFAQNPESYLSFTKGCGHIIRVRRCRYIPLT